MTDQQYNDDDLASVAEAHEQANASAGPSLAELEAYAASATGAPPAQSEPVTTTASDNATNDVDAPKPERDISHIPDAVQASEIIREQDEAKLQQQPESAVSSSGEASAPRESEGATEAGKSVAEAGDKDAEEKESGHLASEQDSSSTSAGVNDGSEAQSEGTSSPEAAKTDGDDDNPEAKKKDDPDRKPLEVTPPVDVSSLITQSIVGLAKSPFAVAAAAGGAAVAAGAATVDATKAVGAAAAGATKAVGSAPFDAAENLSDLAANRINNYRVTKHERMLDRLQQSQARAIEHAEALSNSGLREIEMDIRKAKVTGNVDLESALTDKRSALVEQHQEHFTGLDSSLSSIHKDSKRWCKWIDSPAGQALVEDAPGQMVQFKTGLDKWGSALSEKLDGLNDKEGRDYSERLAEMADSIREAVSKAVDSLMAAFRSRGGQASSAPTAG